MSGFLQALLGLGPGDEEARGRDEVVEPRMAAAAALMVEAARLDGRFTEDEQARIRGLLADRFGLGPWVAGRLMDQARARAEASSDLHGFTSAIKDGFDHEGRLEVVEMLWEVVYADGDLHDYEASLMRRVAGLLYVADGESAAARGRALARLRGGGGPAA